jgi:hypothetical protein
MKSKSIYFLMIVMVVFVNCKNKKPIDSLEVITPQPILSEIRVVLDMVVPKDDIFQIFYTVDGSSNFNEEMSVRVNITGSQVSQSIVFEFPEDIIITRFRIDVGENSNQVPMQINKFTIHHFDKKFEAIGNEFYKYFTPAEQITFNNENSQLTTKQIGERYDPIFYQTDYILNVELEKIQN